MTELELRIREAIIDVPDFPIKGVIYKDITPIFQKPELCKAIVDAMAASFSSFKPDAVLGMESRGFLLGMPLAIVLDVPFIMVRKKGKLPRSSYESSYALEYGTATIEMHKDALRAGQRVLIHDDVLATGGTAAAGADLVKQAGAEIAGFSFISELSFLKGRDRLASFSAPISTFVSY